MPNLGSYVVRVPGREDRKFGSFEEAANIIIESSGYCMLIDPNGEIMLTKGKPPEPN